MFGNWLIALDDSFACSDEGESLVFRQPGKEVWIKHSRLEEGIGRLAGIQVLKVEANPRHETLWESDEGGIYRWAFKHAEEYEAVSPNKYRLDFFAVTDHDYLVIVIEHQSVEERAWVWEVVQSVALQPSSASANAEPIAAADRPSD